jgi:hypothetical protein
MRDQFEGDLKEFENVESTNGVYARFYLHPKLDEAASKVENRPIYADKEYVEIIAAGNANNIIRRPAGDMDKRRFHREYSRFREGSEQTIGTPLTEVTWITRGMVEELAYMKVKTLEQLSELNDQACTKMPGLFDLKRKAQAWVKQATDSAPIVALQEENEALKARLAALEAAMVSKKEKAA